MTAPLQQRDVASLDECLRGCGIALIPTDTVYGLACNPDDELAVKRLYELKGRAAAKPAAIMFFALAHALSALPELGPRTRAAMEALLPGPLTLLLANPHRRFPLACDPSGGPGEVLGVRVPSFGGPLAALAGVSVPALQSSANVSGGPDPRRLEDVPPALRRGVDLVLDGGELPGAASTVIDLLEYEQYGTWRIVREGPLGHAALEQLLG